MTYKPMKSNSIRFFCDSMMKSLEKTKARATVLAQQTQEISCAYRQVQRESQIVIDDLRARNAELVLEVARLKELLSPTISEDEGGAETEMESENAE